MGEELWGGVGGRAALRDAQLAFGVVGEAEVDELDVEVLVEEQVLYFEVAVQDADAVQVVDGRDDLADELAGADLGQVLARAYVVHEIAAFAQLRHQVVTAGQKRRGD